MLLQSNGVLVLENDTLDASDIYSDMPLKQQRVFLANQDAQAYLVAHSDSSQFDSIEEVRFDKGQIFDWLPIHPWSTASRSLHASPFAVLYCRLATPTCVVTKQLRRKILDSAVRSSDYVFTDSSVRSPRISFIFVIKTMLQGSNHSKIISFWKYSNCCVSTTVRPVKIPSVVCCCCLFPFVEVFIDVPQ